MKSNFTIFYSWQSDVKPNRSLILNCIEKAVKELGKSNPTEVKLELNIERDTKDVTGSPSITKTIFNKIDLCDIFIGDVTIINKSSINTLLKNRLTPNPNVMVELGYAVSLLGWDRIICINNTNISSTEQLPFDLRGHRITTFDSKKENCKKELIEILIVAIKSIIDNYDEIVATKLKTKYQKHDYNIYQEFIKISDETILMDSISCAVNSLFTNKYYLDIWDDMNDFYQLSTNKFLIEELDNLIVLLLVEVEKFNSICSTHFHLKDRQNRKYMVSELNELTEEELFDYKQDEVYQITKHFDGESYPDSDKRVWGIQEQLLLQGDKVKETYRNFIMGVKRNLIC